MQKILDGLGNNFEELFERDPQELLDRMYEDDFSALECDKDFAEYNPSMPAQFWAEYDRKQYSHCNSMHEAALLFLYNFVKGERIAIQDEPPSEEPEQRAESERQLVEAQ